MARIRKTSNETKEAIRRKSAAILPNRPTDSGLKAEMIRGTLHRPITDPEYSVLAELDRVVDEANGIINNLAASVDVITEIKDIYYTSLSGLVYTFDEQAGEFCLFECDEDVFDGSSVFGRVLYESEEYPVTAIGASAFTDNSAIKSIVIPSEITEIAAGAFEGCSALESVELVGKTNVVSGAFPASGVHFTVPAEHEAWYREKLSGYSGITFKDTVANNAKRITSLEAAKSVQAEKLSELEAAKGEQAEKLSELESAKGEQAEKLSELESAKSVQAEKLSELETAKSVQAEKLSELEAAKNDHETRIKSIEDNGVGGDGTPGIQGPAGPQGEKGEKGDPGEDGTSAYEAAIAGGYVGTEAEFNADLAGVAGFSVWLSEL